MFNELQIEKFMNQRREPLLDYKVYIKNFRNCTETFEIVAESIANPDPRAETGDFMEATRQRAWDSVKHLSNCYSAGHPISEIRSFYPAALEYWEAYAKYHCAYQDSKEGQNSNVAHLPLLGTGFYQANRLLTFAILLGFEQLVHRLPPLFEYNNPGHDGMLERIFKRLIPGHSESPDTCLRHLPYFKTLKIFRAQEAQRPELMQEYLNDWYTASRREPYFDTADRSLFVGYWAWEAATITYILAIDDSNYNTALFYPTDLVEFARKTRTTYSPIGSPIVEPNELRARAGELCPKSGNWYALDGSGTSRNFNRGEILQDLNSKYGYTVWQLKAASN